MAVENRGPETVVHHPDQRSATHVVGVGRGVMGALGERCGPAGVRPSTGSVGNACAPCALTVLTAFGPFGTVCPCVPGVARRTEPERDD